MTLFFIKKKERETSDFLSCPISEDELPPSDRKIQAKAEIRTNWAIQPFITFTLFSSHMMTQNTRERKAIRIQTFNFILFLVSPLFLSLGCRRTWTKNMCHSFFFLFINSISSKKFIPMTPFCSEKCNIYLFIFLLCYFYFYIFWLYLLHYHLQSLYFCCLCGKIALSKLIIFWKMMPAENFKLVFRLSVLFSRVTNRFGQFQQKIKCLVDAEIKSEYDFQNVKNQ